MIPYLKGFHLTADHWRGDRDSEGWKLPPNKDDVSVVSDCSFSSMDATRAGAHGLDLAREASTGVNDSGEGADVLFHLRERYAQDVKNTSTATPSLSDGSIRDIPHALIGNQLTGHILPSHRHHINGRYQGYLSCHRSLAAGVYMLRNRVIGGG